MKVLVRAAMVAGATMFMPMTAMADPLTYGGLKSMVEGMGHEVKETSSTPGSEKFEVTITTDAFNVPLGLEVSKSGRYVWCAASLGKSTLSPDRARMLLQRAGGVQPTSFWITDTSGRRRSYRGAAGRLAQKLPDTVSTAAGPRWRSRFSW